MAEMPRIFLAHASEDKAQVRKLFADLKARGFDPWLDEIDLMPGQIWKTEIPKAIRRAEIFLACLSSQSVAKRGYVQTEFRQALAAFGERPPGSIYLIPVRLDECEAPDLEIPDRGLSLKDSQWVDVWQEGGLERLVNAIEHALGSDNDPRTPFTEGIYEPRRSEVPSAPEAKMEQEVATAPPEEAAKKRGQGPEAKRSSLWRHPPIVAAIIAAVSAVIAAAVTATLSPPFLHWLRGPELAEQQPETTEEEPVSIARPAGAQTGADLALVLRNSVVAIEATWADGLTNAGFGLIVGAEGEETFVATSNHLLRGREPDQTAEEILVQVFQRPGRQYQGELLGTRDDELDLGVITVHLPSDIDWRDDVLAADPGGLEFGVPVWFIGRDQEWYVPGRSGVVNRVSRLRREIVIDDLAVGFGTAGGPLVSADGIVGMIVRDAGGPVYATLISAVETAFQEWRLPWDLVPYLPGSKNVVMISGRYQEPGSVFKDCDICPEMVVVPGGTFNMGSPESEEDRNKDEGPQHQVTIQSFAMGRYEVTFEQWDACVADGGCSTTPRDERWGRGKRPVINIGWNDAREYIAWLKEKTGEPYRLPSEAEWEYAARAGTETPFWTGAMIIIDRANYVRNVEKTTEVGAYAANAFGLHDTAGNVSEWVEDCWHGNYEGASEDSSAWLKGDCIGRVVRGGSWNSKPSDLRSAVRYASRPNFRRGDVGFGLPGRSPLKANDRASSARRRDRR